MADGQVSVGGALGYAWTLLSQNWRAIWGALALHALAWTVLTAGLLSGNLDLVLAAVVAMRFTKYPVYGSISRAAEGSAGEAASPGHLGIEWRAAESRMVAADLLFWVFILIMAMLVSIALSAPLVGVIMNSGGNIAAIDSADALLRQLGPYGRRIMQFESLLFWMIMLSIGFRLSLSLIASARSGRVAVLSTWRLTRGQFWRLVGATVLVSIPVLLAVIVAAGGAAEASGAVTPGEIFIYAILTGVLAGAATTPMLAGVQLYFYRRLGPAPSRSDDQAKA
jgi:hypothetical protein